MSRCALPPLKLLTIAILAVLPVLSAERVQYDGRDMHRVKVVDDEGRVRVFMQDPNRRDNNDAGFNRPEPNRTDSSRNNDRNDGNNDRGSRPLKRPTRDNND